MNTKGQWAEELAKDHLEKQGLTNIQSNFNTPLGEIDLIMQDQDELVFVEVRYRKHTHFGGPLESVTRSKQKKIYRTAQYYCKRFKTQPPCRFDVVAITDEIEWIKNAFTGNF